VTSPIQSKGVPLSSIFDPYVAGTTKARAAGIAEAGNDTSNIYANIIYGSAAAATGIDSEGADLNTLYAKIGTASYALPINGSTYTHFHQVVSLTGNSTIGFQITSGTTYIVYGTDSASSPTTLASGPVPSGSVKVQFTWGSFTVDTGSTDAFGTTSNAATTPQLISTNPDAHYTTQSVGPSAGTEDRNYTFTIDFFDASLNNISHTIIHLKAIIEGSA